MTSTPCWVTVDIVGSTFLQDFGHAVRRLRKERGMTQADLAKRLGLGRTSVTNLENGDQNPSLSVLPDLAHALGVEPDRLVAEAMGLETKNRDPLAAHVADIGLRRWAGRVIGDSITELSTAKSESPKTPARRRDDRQAEQP